MNALAIMTPTPERLIDLAALLADRVAMAPLSVRGLSLDSRRVRPGDAFVAIAGRSAHGLVHVGAACEAGAVAVLWDARDAAPNLPTGVRGVAVPALAKDLAWLADRAYGSPSQQASVLGITGTNGKTTTAWLLASAFAALGEPGAYMGTVGCGILPDLGAATHTTPDVIGVQASLAELVARGARHVAMEVSSQGLDQGRTDAVRIRGAGFTNLTRDHLDYHGTMEAYAAAKARLFAAPDLEHAVINVRDPFGAELATRLRPGVELLRVQPKLPVAGRFLRASSVEPSSGGLVVNGNSDRGAFRLQSTLIGAFNAENMLVALGLLLASGLALDDAVASLEAAHAPPGRMELWRLGSGAVAVVDYAHTPDALEKALLSLREHCTGEIWCVFGCGGDRDRGKRPQMARVAERLAQHVVLTDDNPRSEASSAILDEIETGLTRPELAVREPDRARAIARACAGARAGDAVLVAGMGHEDAQIRGTTRHPYSDRATVAALAGARS